MQTGQQKVIKQFMVIMQGTRRHYSYSLKEKPIKDVAPKGLFG